VHGPTVARFRCPATTVALALVPAVVVSLAACRRGDDHGPSPAGPPPTAPAATLADPPVAAGPAADATTPAQGPATDADSSAAPSLPQELVERCVHGLTVDAWYGLYLKGQKAGWANLVARRSADGGIGSLAVSLEMTANFAAHGRTRTVTTVLRQLYGAQPPYPLVAAQRLEQTSDGRKEQTLVARPDGVVLTTSIDGGAPAERRFPPTRETAASACVELAFDPAWARPG